MRARNTASIPPRTNPEQAYRVDYRRLQHWNLSERNLPLGTIVMFKEPTIWERHREFVLAASTMIVGLLGLVVALLIQGRRRKTAEGLLRESEERMTFTAHSRYVQSIVFSPDDSLMATVGFDGTAKLWDMPKEDTTRR